MTARVAFKQDDVSRAVKGVTAAGLNVTRVEVKEGKIVVIIGDSEPSVDAPPSRGGLERAIEEDEA